eukprot:CAMPEP_0117760472 /NCGR_PEP_ID=MMETSP0947-20121206/16650_1 /TAXON_ID=44440 /ORGANISM="Chattonella subsalsa, Strain CCMP2191" /LENGTH=410 /DNA_ID=CAMNT_0005581169 /DNA_START=163 /DNA_END=1395 /DNA_ORIENTATION=-
MAPHCKQVQMSFSENDRQRMSDINRKFLSGIIGAMAILQPMKILFESHQAFAVTTSQTSSGSRAITDGGSLLRSALPFSNQEARDLQSAIDGIKTNIKVNRWSQALSGCQRARFILGSKANEMLISVRETEKIIAQEQIEKVKKLLGPLEDVLNSRNMEKIDSAFSAHEAVARAVGDLEEMMIPEEFVREIPEEYSHLPYLKGRAEVELVVVKGPEDKDGKFYVDGTLHDQAKLVLTLDGYNAPITAGNFMDLVDKGFYNGLKITRSDGFVVQTGDPYPQNDNINGYIPKGASEPRTIPLEISIAGEEELIYGITAEDIGKGSLPAALPFQANGALGMARSEADPDSGSSQFFFFLFDSDLTPAGKNVLDGRYTNFGYVTKNAKFLQDLKEGDIIKNAKIIKGKDGLVKT